MSEKRKGQWEGPLTLPGECERRVVGKRRRKNYSAKARVVKRRVSEGLRGTVRDLVSILETEGSLWRVSGKTLGTLKLGLKTFYLQVQ